MQINCRIPADEQEVFAMAYMIGYLGWVPDDLAHAFPDEDFVSSCPNFIPTDLVHMWRVGYDTGVSFYCDHVLHEED